MYVRNATDVVLVYGQSSGAIWLADGEDSRALIGHGYSGRGSHVNKGESETILGWGPIPRGVWRVGRPVNHPRLGPKAFPLTPVGHDAFHRSDFFIHGDNRGANGTASSGCIIAGLAIRAVIEALQIRTLEVVP